MQARATVDAESVNAIGPACSGMRVTPINGFASLTFCVERSHRVRIVLSEGFDRPHVICLALVQD